MFFRFRAGIKFYTHDKPDTFSLHQDCFNPAYTAVADELDRRVDRLLSRTSLPKAQNK